MSKTKTLSIYHVIQRLRYLTPRKKYVPVDITRCEVDGFLVVRANVDDCIYEYRVQRDPYWENVPDISVNLIELKECLKAKSQICHISSGASEDESGILYINGTEIQTTSPRITEIPRELQTEALRYPECSVQLPTTEPWDSSECYLYVDKEFPDTNQVITHTDMRQMMYPIAKFSTNLDGIYKLPNVLLRILKQETISRVFEIKDYIGLVSSGFQPSFSAYIPFTKLNSPRHLSIFVDNVVPLEVDFTPATDLLKTIHKQPDVYSNAKVGDGSTVKIHTEEKTCITGEQVFQLHLNDINISVEEGAYPFSFRPLHVDGKELAAAVDEISPKIVYLLDKYLVLEGSAYACQMTRGKRAILPLRFYQV